MSEEQTNKNNLEELLARFKNEQSNDDLDPFEQEALEGFEQMESKEAVRNFVRTAQVRVHKRLRIQHQEKRSPKTYWVLAASIVLFAGLSLVFYSMLQETEQTRHVVIQEPKVEEQKKIESMSPVGTISETITSTNAATSGFTSPISNTFTLNLEDKKTHSVTNKLVSNDKQNTKQKEYKADVLITEDAKTIVANNSSNETFKTEEAKPQLDSVLSSTKNVTNAAPTTVANTLTWSGGLAATETKRVEAPTKSANISDGKKAEMAKEKVDTRADSDKPSTTFASTAVAVTQAYYEGGTAVLITKLKTQFLKNEVLKSITQKLEIEISLTETNEIKSIAIPNLKDENVKAEITKELKQLTGYKTAQKNGRTIPSVFVFTFQP